MILRFEDLGTFVSVCMCVCVCVCVCTHACLCVLSRSIMSNSSQLWTVVDQAPLSTGSSRQESWSRLSFPPPEYLPDPGIEPTSPVSPALQAGSLLLSHFGVPRKCLRTSSSSYLSLQGELFVKNTDFYQNLLSGSWSLNNSEPQLSST